MNEPFRFSLVKPIGSTVQIKIPVVATVIQRRGEDGNVCMTVQSPGPCSELSPGDTFVFNNGSENEQSATETNSSDSVVTETQIQYMDETGNVVTEEEFNAQSCKY